MPDYFDLDRRLDALVQIAASQSQSMHEMAVSIQDQGRQIRDQGRQIQEHGRQIDRIIDAFMGVARNTHEHQGDIESHERRIERLEDDRGIDENGKRE